MCVYAKLPYEIEANVQQKSSLIFSFHITRSLNPCTLKTHCIFLSCHQNYFSMACKLLCESWKPEASTEPFVFMLKSCHLMDLISTAAALCLLLPSCCPEQSWCSTCSRELSLTVPAVSHRALLAARHRWRWTSVTAQSSRADSSPQLPGCSLAQNRRKHVMLLVLSFFHGSTFKCFAEKHQELSSAAHRTRCEIFRENFAKSQGWSYCVQQ